MNVRKLINSFKYAIEGIKTAFGDEQNMKIHIFIMICVIVGGIIFKIELWEWIVCISWFSMVIGGELFNTAIENTVDVAMPDKNKLAKVAKDTSAGGVLVFALGSFIVGLMIFAPRIWNLFVK